MHLVCSIHLPIASQTEKCGVVMLEYDLVEYAKLYDLLINEVYHSNARSKMYRILGYKCFFVSGEFLNT